MPYTSCSRAGQCAALTLVVRGTPQQAFAAFTVRDGRLARNPAHDVPLPRAAKSDKVYLTIDQVEQLAEAAGEFRLVILFLA